MSPLEKNRQSGNDEYNSGKRECIYMDTLTSRDDERRLILAREQGRIEEQDRVNGGRV